MPGEDAARLLRSCRRPDSAPARRSRTRTRRRSAPRQSRPVAAARRGAHRIPQPTVRPAPAQTPPSARSRSPDTRAVAPGNVTPSCRSAPSPQPSPHEPRARRDRRLARARHARSRRRWPSDAASPWTSVNTTAPASAAANATRPRRADRQPTPVPSCAIVQTAAPEARSAEPRSNPAVAISRAGPAPREMATAKRSPSAGDDQSRTRTPAAGLQLPARLCRVGRQSRRGARGVGVGAAGAGRSRNSSAQAVRNSCETSSAIVRSRPGSGAPIATSRTSWRPRIGSPRRHPQARPGAGERDLEGTNRRARGGQRTELDLQQALDLSGVHARAFLRLHVHRRSRRSHGRDGQQGQRPDESTRCATYCSASRRIAGAWSPPGCAAR